LTTTAHITFDIPFSLSVGFFSEVFCAIYQKISTQLVLVLVDNNLVLRGLKNAIEANEKGESNFR
jgi:hypothetical protein